MDAARLFFFILIFSCGMARLHMCFLYRGRLLEYVKCARLAGQYELAGQRLDALDAVSFEEMVFKFWRPMRSFYKGTVLEEVW